MKETKMVRLSTATLEKLNQARRQILAQGLECKKSKSVYGEHVSADEVVSIALDSMITNMVGRP